MKKKMNMLLALLFLIQCHIPVNAQTKSGDVTLPNSIPAGKEKLVLNGTGIREKYFIDLYVGGLYLLQKNADGKSIVEANEAMAIKLHIVSDVITSKRMEEGIQEGFEKSTGDKTAPLKDKISQFIAVFKEPIQIGDVYDLVYTPAEGLTAYKNNIRKIQVAGLDFKKALFGIWLGNDPADDDLKKAMLGK